MASANVVKRGSGGCIKRCASSQLNMLAALCTGPSMKTSAEAWPGAHQLERDGRAPRMPYDHGLFEVELTDHKIRGLEEYVHRVAVRRRRVRRPDGQAMSALVERDQATGGELAGEAIPIARVGAQTMKQKHRRVAPRAGLGPPFDVMKADAPSLEPSVGRFCHRP